MNLRILDTMSLRIFTLYLIVILFSLGNLQAQDKINIEKKNQVIINPDGSKTIITYSVNENGEDIKTVTIIKVTEFLDGSKLISKSVKIFNFTNKEETLTKSFVQSSFIRPRRRMYREVRKNNPNITKPDIDGPGTTGVSPDGR